MKNKLSILISIIIFIGLYSQALAAPAGLSSLSYVLKKCSDISRSSCTSTIYNNSTTFSMSAEGVYDLIVSATDNAGYSKTETFTYYIDKTAPTSAGISGISTAWVQSDTVNITCSDALSGCDASSYQYRVSNSNFACNSAGTWISGTTYTANTNKYICSRVKDSVGNGFRYSSTYHINKVDGVDPTHSISYTPSVSTWNNVSTRVDITCADSLSGCNMYNIPGWTRVGNTYSQTFLLNTSGNIELRDNSSGYNNEIVNYNVTNIDKNDPTVDVDFGSYIPPTWTKNNVSASVTCNDTNAPISGCKSSTYQIRDEANPFSCDSSGIWGGSSLNISTAIGTNKVRYICARAQDNAGNYGYSSVYTVKIDKVTPSYSDISSTGPVNGAKLLADMQNITIGSSRAGGAPITLIEGYVEDSSTLNSYESIKRDSTTDLTPGNAEELQITANMTNVDLFRLAGGYREYSFKITKVKDAAGNEITDLIPGSLPIFKYRVFANTSNITTKHVIVNELDDGNIADASNNELSIEIKDTYGNTIVSATDINRKINFYFDVNNSLRLNQFAGTADAVEVTRPNGSQGDLLTNSTTFNDEPSTNGIYTYLFQIYTPTFSSGANDGRQWANGNMTIYDINYIISEDSYPFINNNGANSYSGAIIFDGGNTNIDLVFKPLYLAEFIGDFSLGIFADTIQSAKLKISKAGGSTVSGINSVVRLGFGQTDSWGVNIEHPNYDFIYEPNSVTPITAYEGHMRFPATFNNLLNLGNIPAVLPGNIDFNAKVSHVGGTVNGSLPTYISSHIKYDLNGRTVVYDTHTIGKSRYVDGTVLANISQVGLKVMGRIQSKNQTDLTIGQSGTDLFAVGNNTKAGLKEIIKRQAALIIKNISGSVGGIVTDLSGNVWGNPTGAKLKNDTVLYYDLSTAVNKNLQIGNGSDLVAGGVKTLIVKGGNIYMKNNITYSNKANDILGIISIEDNGGNGGNIYLDTQVTHLVGMYYADKSIVSYDGVNEIDGSIGVNLLKNQFYLYGTLFSENTIGGAVIQKCPYYITTTCDIDTAKKYDLNFLRRYFVYDADADGDADDVYNSGTGYFSYPHPNFKYPMIIEYNPNVQSKYPPLFGNDEI